MIKDDTKKGLVASLRKPRHPKQSINLKKLNLMKTFI